MEIDFVAFGQYLRRVRKAKGMTQRECAAAIQRSLPFYGHIERGTRKMSLSTFLKLINALDLSIKEVIEVCGSPNSQAR